MIKNYIVNRFCYVDENVTHPNYYFFFAFLQTRIFSLNILFSSQKQTSLPGLHTKQVNKSAPLCVSGGYIEHI